MAACTQTALAPRSPPGLSADGGGRSHGAQYPRTPRGSSATFLAALPGRRDRAPRRVLEHDHLQLVALLLPTWVRAQVRRGRRTITRHYLHPQIIRARDVPGPERQGTTTGINFHSRASVAYHMRFECRKNLGEWVRLVSPSSGGRSHPAVLSLSSLVRPRAHEREPGSIHGCGPARAARSSPITTIGIDVASRR